MKIKKFDSMNVIPFIDIMLVLLTIVLTFSTFIANGNIDITLPKASSSTKSELKFVQISIDKKGIIRLDAKTMPIEELKQKLSKLPKTSNISLKADENTPFKIFVQVVDILKILQLDKISIVTKIVQ